MCVLYACEREGTTAVTWYPPRAVPVLQANALQGCGYYAAITIIGRIDPGACIGSRRNIQVQNKAGVKEITIYTDGACSGNPGPGGWAAILVFGEHEREISGFEPRTTNNRMELRAAVEALAALKEPCRVRLHTDSAYLHRAFTDGWLGRWQQNGWKTASKKPVENQDLWRRLLEVSREHDVEWVKVKGHASDEMNNRVDRLAVQVMRAQGVP